MKQKIQINYGADWLEINIGNKRFYGSEELHEFAEAVSKAFEELGYESEMELCY